MSGCFMSTRTLQPAVKTMQVRHFQIAYIVGVSGFSYDVSSVSVESERTFNMKQHILCTICMKCVCSAIIVDA